MSNINFPGSPSDGDTFFANGIYYVFNSTKNIWKVFETGSNFILNDAQTLDGELPSFYLDYNNFTNTPPPLLYGSEDPPDPSGLVDGTFYFQHE